MKYTYDTLSEHPGFQSYQFGRAEKIPVCTVLSYHIPVCITLDRSIISPDKFKSSGKSILAAHGKSQNIIHFTRDHHLVHVWQILVQLPSLQSLGSKNIILHGPSSRNTVLKSQNKSHMSAKSSQSSAMLQGETQKWIIQYILATPKTSHTHVNSNPVLDSPLSTL